MSPGPTRRRTCLGGPLSPDDHDIRFRDAQLFGRSNRRPADALHGGGIDPEPGGDLAHPGAPWLTQRSLYGVFLGLR
jgi:hypothetical protein